VFTGGTSDKTYVLAGTRGWGIVVPPLLPYEALREQLDLYRATCAEHGNEPDIVWIHACYMDEDRDTALREAEAGIKGFLAGNASPLVEHEKPPADDLNAAGYGFYTVGIDHRQPRRLRPLAGDQEPGAVRPARAAALPGGLLRGLAPPPPKALPERARSASLRRRAAEC